MKVHILFLLGVLVPSCICASGFNPYDWEKNRSRFSLSAAEQKMSELMLKNHFEYDYGFENEQFIMRSIIHRIVFVNNNEAIQKHNRIVVPMQNTIELTELRARAINKDGKIVLFDKSNLKEMKEEESGNAYRIFAIEGIELGSEVEYFFVRKMYSKMFDRAYMQMDVPVKAASFTLRCPKHLKFDFKSYYGCAAVKTESTETDNIYTAVMNDVPAMQKEVLSYFDANRQRIEFKLAYNTSRSQARLYTWDDAAKAFFDILSAREKEDEKTLARFIKTLNDDVSSPLPLRIRNVEQKLKLSVQVNAESSDAALSKLSDILKYKVASREGMARLFFAVFKNLNIPCHIVVTCSRENFRFDGEFDSWSYLDDYILYFPDTRSFLAPYVMETRYPLIPPGLTSQKGLFIEPLAVGGLHTGLGTVQDIPALDYRLSADNLDISVTFNEDMTGNEIKLKRDLTGYNASFFTPYYHLMTEEQRFAMVEGILKETAPDLKIKNWIAKPGTDPAADAFFINVDFQSAHFLEKAGPRILFKIGQLIGPQIEMYRDNERVTEIENEFNRTYERVIKVTIPEGYTIRNLQDIKFDVAYKEGSEAPFSFQSTFDIEEQHLTIKVKEYYKQIYAPLSRYEEYRKVINAAADFNKVTLVLEKKK